MIPQTGIRKFILNASTACLLVLTFLAWNLASAQLNNQPINLPKYDHQPVHFGFTLAVNSSSFRLAMVPDFKTQDSIYDVQASSIAGLNLGIVSNLRMGEHFDLRFIPSLSFSQRNISYTFNYGAAGQGITIKKIESTYLEFPVDLKYKSKRVNNYRIYVLAGWKSAIDMVSQAKVRDKDKDIVKLGRNDYGYEIGVGADFYLEYFKFSPEIKMFHGLSNLLVKDESPFSSPLEKLYSQTFMVSFLFE